MNIQHCWLSNWVFLPFIWCFLFWIMTLKRFVVLIGHAVSRLRSFLDDLLQSLPFAFQSWIFILLLMVCSLCQFLFNQHIEIQPNKTQCYFILINLIPRLKLLCIWTNETLLFKLTPFMLIIPFKTPLINYNYAKVVSFFIIEYIKLNGTLNFSISLFIG